MENVVFDVATGEFLYCVVTSGGVLGVGGTLRTLPWGVLQGSSRPQVVPAAARGGAVPERPSF
jgi:hypothetical protein